MNDVRHRGSGRVWIRIPLFLTVAAVVGAPLVVWATTGWADLRALPHTPTATPADALADVAAVLALTAWAWLVLGAALTILESAIRMPGRALAPRITPAVWRRAVLSAVGIGVLGAPVAVAQASPGESPGAVAAMAQPDPGRVPAASVTRAIQGLPLPDRPYGRLTVVGSDPNHERRQASPQRVTVRTGDSLWAIAQHHLGPNATVQAVATEWRRWYAANRACIGPNPNLILPGMVLHAPATRAAS